MIKRRLPMIFVLLASTGGVVGSALLTGGKRPTVDTAAVRGSELEEVVFASGRIEAVRELTLYAPRTGLVAALYLEEGERVEEGQEIIFLKPLLALGTGGMLAQGEEIGSEAVVEQSRLVVERLHQHLRVAERTYQRLRDLSAAGLVASDDLERAEMEFETSRLRLEEAKRELGRISDSAAPASIVSPFGGFILEAAVEEGQLVGAGQPLVTLADVEDLQVTLLVPEGDVAQVEPGQEVRLQHPAWPEETFPAEVVEVAPRATHRPTVQGEETLVEVEASVLRPGELKPGFNVDGEIVTRRLDRALFVPVEAVWEGDDETWVLVVAEGRARRRAVKVGVEVTGDFEIVSGLAEGERVVLDPQPDFEDGGEVISRGAVDAG